MTMMKAAGALLGLAVWLAVVSLEETTPVASTKRYCGRGLTTNLQLLCNGIYNAVENFVTSSSTTELFDQPRFRTRRSALTMTSLFRRRRRGVYDECCRKSCSVAELSIYCGVP